MTNKPISRKSNIVVQDLENEVLIYDLTINNAFCLNETSGLVYALCDGKRTVAEISNEMSKQLNDLVSEDFVNLALDELRKNNLLENSDELTNHFAGMSRREVVKKVGLASMVALPVIVSVAAPSAAMAQSCGAMGGFGISPQPSLQTCANSSFCTQSNCNAMATAGGCATGMATYNNDCVDTSADPNCVTNETCTHFCSCSCSC